MLRHYLQRNPLQELVCQDHLKWITFSSADPAPIILKDKSCWQEVSFSISAAKGQHI